MEGRILCCLLHQEEQDLQSRIILSPLGNYEYFHPSLHDSNTLMPFCSKKLPQYPEADRAQTKRFPSHSSSLAPLGQVCGHSSICQALLTVTPAIPDVFSSLARCPLSSRIDSSNESPGRMSPPIILPPFPQPPFSSQPVLQHFPEQQLIPASLDPLDEGLGQSLGCGSWW